MWSSLVQGGKKVILLLTIKSGHSENAGLSAWSPWPVTTTRNSGVFPQSEGLPLSLAACGRENWQPFLVGEWVLFSPTTSVTAGVFLETHEPDVFPVCWLYRMDWGPEWMPIFQFFLGTGQPPWFWTLKVIAFQGHGSLESQYTHTHPTSTHPTHVYTKLLP